MTKPARELLQRQLVAVKALAATARPALIAALPAYAGLGAVVAVVMGPSGMRPGDMAEAAAASPLIRAVLWAAWLAALAPAARRLLLAPEAAFLRWLPIGRPLFSSTQAALLVALELPWAVLWHLGSPPPAGIAAALAAAGFHAALAIRPRGLGAELAALALVAVIAALVARPEPDAIVALAGAAALGIAVPAAFRRAAEAPIQIWRPRPRRLVAHYAGQLFDAALGGRVIVAATVAGGLAGLFARVNDLDAEATLAAALVAAAFGCVGVAARIALVLADQARLLEWVFASTGTSRERQVAALAASASIAAALAGAAVGAVIFALTGHVASIAAAAMAPIGVVAVAAVVASRPARGRSARVWAAALATAAGLSLALAATGPLALALPLALAVACFGSLLS
jgi:hypothetical protein